jgi:hypothetical protein
MNIRFDGFSFYANDYADLGCADKFPIMNPTDSLDETISHHDFRARVSVYAWNYLINPRISAIAVGCWLVTFTRLFVA